MTSRPFEDQWHNRVIWADKRVFDSQRATSTAGVAAGDQLPTRRTRSLPPEPSSCLSAGHYDRRHLAKDRGGTVLLSMPIMRTSSAVVFLMQALLIGCAS